MPPLTTKKAKSPVWAGPSSNLDNGGITFSLLSRFLACRERFRLLVVEGLKPQDSFNHRLEYGNLWHLCEEYEARKQDWVEPLTEYARKLCQRYPQNQEQVEHWFNVCKLQFPLYLDYWKGHPDSKNKIPMMSEVSFRVLYTLPSSRRVFLRGKWDSVDLVGRAKEARVCLQENKTKGDIDEIQLQRQLLFDLQTMIYVVALREAQAQGWPMVAHNRMAEPCWHYKFREVRYNVIRRPLSGGKGTIVRHKPSKNNPRGEGKEEYYKRVARYIEDDPGHYFMRWSIVLTDGEIEKFKRECLNPILEQLYDWWVCISECTGDPFDYESRFDGNLNYQVPALHWRTPHGWYDPLMEGNPSELDSYLLTKSEIGLSRVTNLFPELS